MATLPRIPQSINLPADTVFYLRNQLMEACALAEAVADQLAAIPEGSVKETLQALANVCERIIRECLAKLEELATDPAHAPN